MTIVFQPLHSSLSESNPRINASFAAGSMSSGPFGSFVSFHVSLRISMRKSKFEPTGLTTSKLLMFTRSMDRSVLSTFVAPKVSSISRIGRGFGRPIRVASTSVPVRCAVPGSGRMISTVSERIAWSERTESLVAVSSMVSG